MMPKVAPVYMLAQHAISLLLLSTAVAGGNGFSLSDLQVALKQYDCVGLRGTTDAHTKQLLKECMLLMRTKFMQDTREFILNAPLGELKKARQEYYSGANKRVGRSVRDGCPVMDKAYLQTHRNIDGRRSLSPYGIRAVYHPHRFPQYIITARCLCEGCIDNATGREIMYMNGLPVHSELFNYHFPVLYRKSKSEIYTEKRTEAIGAGCTCQYS